MRTATALGCVSRQPPDVQVSAARRERTGAAVGPLSVIIASDHATILYYSRQYDSTLKQCRSVLEPEPTNRARHSMIPVYLQLGRYEKAAEPGPDFWEDDRIVKSHCAVNFKFCRVAVVIRPTDRQLAVAGSCGDSVASGIRFLIISKMLGSVSVASDH